jgi:RHS repeat-associated protein
MENNSRTTKRRYEVKAPPPARWVWGYTYNGLEQLAIRTLTTGGTDVTHFIHDIFGNAIAETGGGGPTGATGTLREYIWLPEAGIAPTMSSSTEIARPLAVVEDVETAAPLLWYVHVDHLHRPIRMTNATKATVWTASWLPWGGVQSITGTGAINLRFPGQWFQLETGLHYNWHRSYDPSTGRYTQPDPLGFVDGPSVYGYAGGSPQRWVDPNGLISLPPKPPGAGSLVCEAGLNDLACKFVLRYVPGLGKFAALYTCSGQADTSSGGSPQNGPPTKPTKDEVRDSKDLFGQGPDGASDALRQLEDIPIRLAQACACKFC